MDKQLKNTLLAITFGVCLFAAVMNLNVVLSALAALLGLLQPIIIGGMLAFVLNVPMSAIERRLAKLPRAKQTTKAAQARRSFSLILTVLLVVLVLVLLSVMVVPQIVSSAAEATRQVQLVLPQLQKLLDSFGIDVNALTGFDLTNFNQDLLQKLTAGVGQAGTALLGTVSSITGLMVNILMAVVFAFYFLLGKEMLTRQAKWVLRKLLPERICAAILHIGQCLQETYTSFFSGQCIEACILGLLMFAAFSICRLPYAGLIAVLTAVTSFIPYVGSFLSCALGVVLILLVNPWQALLAFVVYQAVQFCENQFIYPRVVGSAVGLPAMYTILAVFLGGALFGVVGMIFFIPLMATVYTLLKDADQAEANASKPKAEAD